MHTDELILAVDTATDVESVALISGATTLGERATRRTKGHGPTLLDTIDDLFHATGTELGQIDALICGLGPGSFTGLRVGLATLKGLAVATGRPLYGALTTSALVAALPGHRVLAIIDAYRNEVFACGAGLQEPVCCNPDELMARVPEPRDGLTLLGSGALRYSERLLRQLPTCLVPDNDALHWPRAALLVSTARATGPAPLATLEPAYVRRSDAEINYPNGFPDASVSPPQSRRRRDD